MTCKSRVDLKQLFKRFKKPSEDDFACLIDSMVNKNDDPFLGVWDGERSYKPGDVVLHKEKVWIKSGECDGDGSESTSGSSSSDASGDQQEHCSNDEPGEVDSSWRPVTTASSDNDWVMEVTDAEQGTDTAGEGDAKVMYANPQIEAVGLGTDNPQSRLEIKGKNGRFQFETENRPGPSLIVTDGVQDSRLAVGRRKDYAAFVTDCKAGFQFLIDAACDSPDEGAMLHLLPVARGSLGIGCHPDQGFALDVHGQSRSHGLFVSTDIKDIDTQSVETLPAALDVVSQLRPVRFRWDAASGLADDTQIGLIAAEVAELFPAAVKGEACPSTGSVDNTGGDNTEHGPVGNAVAYHAIVALLIKACQEQQSHIDALKGRMERLEARLDQIDPSTEQTVS